MNDLPPAVRAEAQCTGKDSLVERYARALMIVLRAREPGLVFRRVDVPDKAKPIRGRTRRAA